MTVVVFDGKTLASDSMVSYTTGEFSHSAKKIFRLSSGALLGAAGDSDVRDVLKLLQSVTTEADIPERKVLVETRTDCELLLVLPNKEVFSIGISMRDGSFDVWTASIDRVPGKYAIGHGSPFAMTVLDIGGTSEQAVKAAIKRSLFCGGKIQTLSLSAPIRQAKQTKRVKVPQSGRASSLTTAKIPEDEKIEQS